jgi:hypothetical protein
VPDSTKPQIFCCVFSGLCFLTDGVIQPPTPGLFKHSFALFCKHPRACARIRAGMIRAYGAVDCVYPAMMSVSADGAIFLYLAQILIAAAKQATTFKKEWTRYRLFY